MTVDPKHVHQCTEYDNKERECQILLYTRKVENPAVELLQNPIKVMAGLEDEIHLHHWTLVAYFEGGDRLMSFEAAEDENNIIQVYRTAGVPAVVDTQFEVAVVMTSPEYLLQMAQKHPFNGTKYCAASKNCQGWVKEYARMISDKLSKAMDKYKSFEITIALNPVTIATLPITGIVLTSNKLKSINYKRSCEFASNSFKASFNNCLLVKSAKMSFNSFS